jgi:hypothetical protein
VLDEHCVSLGRDPSTIERSTQFRPAHQPPSLIDLSRQFHLGRCHAPDLHLSPAIQRRGCPLALERGRHSRSEDRPTLCATVPRSPRTTSMRRSGSTRRIGRRSILIFGTNRARGLESVRRSLSTRTSPCQLPRPCASGASLSSRPSSCRRVGSLISISSDADSSSHGRRARSGRTCHVVVSDGSSFNDSELMQ